MPDTIRLVIAWTCVAVFIASAIITLLALLGVIRLPHQKYLNRLFTVIIVAIVGTCASFFKDFISSGTNEVATTNLPTHKGDYSDTNDVSTTVSTNSLQENGWIGFKHSGSGYVAKFFVKWNEDSEPRSWRSGEQTKGYSYQFPLKGNAREIKITAQAKNGSLLDPWNNIFTLELTNGPPNKTYEVGGDRRRATKVD